MEFKYDYLGRRVEKLVRAGWNGTLYTTVVWQNRYLYDGWSLLAEYSVAGSALTLVRSYLERFLNQSGRFSSNPVWRKRNWRLAGCHRNFELTFRDYRRGKPSHPLWPISWPATPWSMKIAFVGVILFSLVTMSGCAAAPANIAVKTSKTYRFAMPNFVVEYTLPPELELGYGGLKTTVTFDHPEKDQYAFHLGDGAYEKGVGTVFQGVVGDFRDWDLHVDLFVIKFNRSQQPMRSVEELADFTRKILSKKYVLADGSELIDLGDLMIERIGSYSVVVATSSDQYHVRHVKLKGGSETAFEPYQMYYIRLDDEMTIGIRVWHDKEKRLTPKWHADSRAMIAAIIENMRAERMTATTPTGSGLQK